jgi:hypothetical protein
MNAGLQLTLTDLMRDKMFSLLLLLGVALSEFLKSQLESASASGGSAVALLELTLICCAVGYVLRAVDALSDQFSAIVERAAISPSWSPRKAGLARGSGCLLRILRAGLRIAIAVLVLAISGIALSVVLRTLGIELLDGDSNFTRWAVPLPVESVIFVTAVAALIVGAWFVRGISYLVQARWQTILR